MENAPPSKDNKGNNNNIPWNDKLVLGSSKEIYEGSKEKVSIFQQY